MHEIKVQQSFSYMKSKYKEVNANTNLWIPPSHHIWLTFNNLAHINVDGAKRFPLLYCYEKGQIRCGNEREVIGPFQKARLVGRLEYGCLVCHQTPDNLISDLMSYLS